MMLLFTSALLFISIGVSESHYQQMLTCPYTAEDANRVRVWCKRDPTNYDCCTGFAFGPGITELQDGSVRVQDYGTSFVISVTTPPDGDGMYWCGLQNGSAIVKLAESQFYCTPPYYVWAILRWVFFFLLLLPVLVLWVHSSRKNRQDEKDKVYETVAN